MAKNSAVQVNENAIIWEEFTSAKGKKYEVGHLAEPGNANGGRPGQEVKKTDFGIACNWPVGDNSWITTDADFHTTSAISRYKLHSNDAAAREDVGGYAYRLEFSNEEHYDYHFYDQEGDSYRCNTFSNTDHFVRYNSDRPTIAYVTG